MTDKMTAAGSGGDVRLSMETVRDMPVDDVRQAVHAAAMNDAALFAMLRLDMDPYRMVLALMVLLSESRQRSYDLIRHQMPTILVPSSER
jgi:hypothetical protein